MKREDLLDKRFHHLIVLRKVSSTRSGMTRWECLCDCGNKCIVASKHLKSGAQKSCSCLKKKRKGKLHPQWKGCGELSGDMWYNIVNHSMSRTKVDMKISIKYAWKIYLEQDKLCALSGVPIHFGTDFQTKTASLDRIDSSKGYIVENVQWVHKDVNRMKNIYNQDYFIDVCTLIANYQGGVCPVK